MSIICKDTDLLNNKQDKTRVFHDWQIHSNNAIKTAHRSIVVITNKNPGA